MSTRPPMEAQAVTILSVEYESLNSLHCPGCSESLDLSQPDSGIPDVILGICEGCGVWFLIDPSTPRGPARVISLASLIDALRDAKRASGPTKSRN